MDKRAEAEYFNREYEDTAREFLDSNYAVANSSFEAYREALASRCVNADLLEYGCGNRPHALEFAKLGARYTGIDLSPVAVQQAQAAAREQGVEDARFLVMDGDALEFEDESFDIVCGTGILHHLEMDRALAEIARVLRPDGFALFREPLGHNPIINLVRRMTPEARTEDERPLRMPDFDGMRRLFGRVEYRPYHLLSLGAIPLKRTRAFPRLVRRLDAADQALLPRLPRALSGQAWLVLMELSQPRRGAQR